MASQETVVRTDRPIVVDATNHIAGRLASNVAKFAKKKGIPTVEKFFSNKTATELVKKHHSADILIAVNVLPHVPNLNDFLKGIKKILKPNGTVIVQFSAYLSKLISQREFDTIYHEHYSYFSLFTLNKIFSAHDLKIFDVDELSIHGGSLRIYATHKKQKVIVSKKIQKLIAKEKKLTKNQQQHLDGILLDTG